MAHYANVQDGVVVQVVVVPDEHEDSGNEYLNGIGLSGQWLKTSYNTYAGTHRLGGVPFRKNFAGEGFSYDEGRDAFIPPKPYGSWVLDEETCLWGPPVPMPEEFAYWVWDEDSVSWVDGSPNRPRPS